MVLNVIQHDLEAIKEAARIVREGGLVAFPTETVYGLAAHAFNEEAVCRLLEVKGRARGNPLTLHLASVGGVESLVEEIPEGARRLMERFWPGPLTIILKKSASVLPVVTAGLSTVGLRVPDHPVALDFIRFAGVPVVGTSANRAGRPSPTKAEHVIQDLKDLIDAVLDAGETRTGIESTVIDFSGEHPRILRPGVITRAEIEAVIKTPVEDARHSAPAREYPRYQPQCFLVYSRKPLRENSVRLQAFPPDRKILVVTLDRTLLFSGSQHIQKMVLENEDALAKHLFAILRDAEQKGFDIIVVDAIRREGKIGDALIYRIEKAAQEIWDGD